MLDEAGIIGIILGLVQVIKNFGVPKKYLAIVALGLGIGLKVLISGPTVENALIGAVLGLSSSGLYSGGKSIVKNSKKVSFDDSK